MYNYEDFPRRNSATKRQRVVDMKADYKTEHRWLVVDDDTRTVTGCHGRDEARDLRAKKEVEAKNGTPVPAS